MPIPDASVGVALLARHEPHHPSARARYDEALECYLRAIKLSPNLGDDIYLMLGNIRFKRQEREEAVRCWEQALALDPGNAIVRTNLDAVRQVL